MLFLLKHTHVHIYIEFVGYEVYSKNSTVVADTAAAAAAATATDTDAVVVAAESAALEA